MKGLSLAELYYNEYGKAMINKAFSEYRQYIAVGLVGEGSECFGFDDEYSQDHDFGPGFCIWLPDSVFQEVGARMQSAYMQLPREYKGFYRLETPQGAGRVGVMSIESFFQKFTGSPGIPENNLKWFSIPERYLATATNGKIFCDYYGAFSKIRDVLKRFYPEDVMKKKMANRAALMAQAGQYNYPRCMKRGEIAGAYLACAEFVKNALSCTYLLNRQYMPFYKWAFKGAENFFELTTVIEKLKKLIQVPDTVDNKEYKEMLIEAVCIDLEKAFRDRGFTKTKSTFLLDHGEEIMTTIEDDKIRSIHIMVDVN